MRQVRFLGQATRRRASDIRWLLPALLVLVEAACGEISQGGGDGVSAGGRAGGGGRSGAGGAAGRAGSSSAGRGGSGGSLVEVDAGPIDPGGAGGSSGTGGGSAGTSSVPDGCPEPAPIAEANHPIVIQSIHFDRSEVTLRNASNTTQTLVGGNEGWQWCNIPGYSPVIRTEEDIVLAPGETFKFILLERLGGQRALFPGDEAGDTNELGIYTTTGAFDSPELIAAYVSWGLGSILETREYVAVLAELWTHDEHITIEPGHAGFVATGDVTRAAGYTSVPARCLPR